MNQLRILAIETSCDETAVAIIEDGAVKSNIIASQAFKTHSQFGGVVPEVAAREHVKVIIPTIELALAKAKTSLEKIDAIAVTQGPGLATSLMVGVDTAKALALAMNKPLLPINHIEGHIYANFITDHKFPALVLTVSGGHTLLVFMKDHGEVKIVGETVDDAAGEAFDKTARLLGLGYPGGAILSELAKEGDSARFKFPRPMINSKDLNFSFSGLKTAVLYEFQKHKKIDHKLKADFAASIQAAIIESLIAKTEKAIQEFGPNTIMLGGGVAANDLLRKNFKQLARKYKLACSIPKFEYCTDNAAMIGLAAYHRFKHGKAKPATNFSAIPQMALK